MDDEIDLLVNRLNFDPIVFKGCSEKELYLIIALVALPLCGLFGVIGSLLWGNVFFGILIGGILGVIGIFVVIHFVERLKRDKEPGYLQQILFFKLENKRLYRSPVIRRTGTWMIGRYLK